MKNYVQKGENLTVTAAADASSGDVVTMGNIVGIAAGDAKTGDPLDIVTVGVFDLPKVAALAIAVGDVVYYDPATKLVNKTASGNTKIGVAITVAADPSGSVNVRLNGVF